MSELLTSPEHHPFSPALEGAAQTTLTIHAGLQVLEISVPVLPSLRRTSQLPPLSLPSSSTCSRRSPQTAPPPEECDRADHPAGRMTPDWPHSTSGDTGWREP